MAEILDKWDGPKMDPEIKEQWLVALRSGRYQQTKSRLRDETGFCCLGVLCDVIEPDGWRDDVDYAFYGCSDGDLVKSMPPPRITEKAKIYNVDGQLSEFNDVGHSFAEIADWIERWL